jgi:acyl-CoA synthetase (AMP-forming)/AMP-acid ligase II
MKKEDILQYCSQHLPKYMIPESVEFRDSLPTTSSGKVDRKKLSDSAGIASRSQNAGMEQGFS